MLTPVFRPAARQDHRPPAKTIGKEGRDDPVFFGDDAEESNPGWGRQLSWPTAFELLPSP
jgi:hypothetical protein